jgi:hypothetical protein
MFGTLQTARLLASRRCFGKAKGGSLPNIIGINRTHTD